MSDRPMFIGIAGEPHSGKTTFAWALQKFMARQHMQASVYNVSDGMAAVARALGVMNIRDRATICSVGDLFRQRDRDVWLKVLEGKICDDQPEVAIIPGLRLLQDLAWLRSFGGILCIIRRRDYDIPWEDPKYKEILNLGEVEGAVNIRVTTLRELEEAAHHFAKKWCSPRAEQFP